MAVKISGVEFYGGGRKPPIEKRVENLYPLYKEGKISPWMRIFKSQSIAGCRMKKICNQENEIRNQVLENMQEMAFKLKIEHGEQGPKFIIDWVSPGYDTVLGYNLGAAIGTDILRNVHPDDLPGLMEFIKERLTSKSGGIALFRSRKADGTYIYTEGTGTPIIDDKGIVVGAVIVSRDVSKRMEMENKFKGIFDKSPVAIEVFSPEGNILDFNPACAKLFGVSSREALGEFNLFMDPNISEEMKDRLKKDGSASYEAPFDFSKVPYPTTEKGIKHFAVHINKIAGDGVGYIAQVVDVTESVKLNAELLATSADKDKFMSMMAHDLRSPFNGILGFGELFEAKVKELLQSGQCTIDDLRELDVYITTLRGSSQKVFNLLETLIDWGRLNSGKMNTEIKILNMRDIVTEVIGPLTVNSFKKSVTVSNMVDERAYVKGMENMVGRIVANLVSNAIKFTKANCEITISSSAKGKFVEITVADNGVGIPAHVLPMLFGAVNNAVTTTGTAGEKGNGLGLPMVAEMVKRNGGEIRVESEEGKGSRFIFTLPAAQG